ncbi:hypothetical protein [Nonomuraea sp. NEAU-A123]|uniref:hypothetical protein n=1 Tax=Nonomuraea sp. NEAU-A123 TaxID=2839649 RepID=UPI001BE49F58|nr:hypothetical protein [Nonomuraea sp. NEAU-A123]MBT2225367.1 hypothetical protein [Nonomuraea sp. NEAU-A123]
MKRLREWVHRDAGWAAVCLALWGLLVAIVGVVVGGAALGRDYFNITATPSPSASPTPSISITQPRPTPAKTADGRKPKPKTEPTSHPVSPTSATDSQTEPETVPTSEGSVPKGLVGRWIGRGNQYAYDDFTHEVDVTLTADAEFRLSFGGGATNDEGVFEADSRTIIFQGQTGSYEWQWRMSTYAGRKKLTIINSGGGQYVLYKR